MRKKFGHLMWDCEELGLVGWVVLVLSFLLTLKDMEVKHHMVLGIFCFKGRHLITILKKIFVN